jgi:O-methyltransferase
MKSLARSLLPESLLRRWHLFRHHAQYVHIPKRSITFFEDGLLTGEEHSVAFLKDERFTRAYELGANTNSWGGRSIRWRAFVACWAGQYAARLPGDFVECGVNRGGLSRMIVDYLRFETLNKKFFLVDTFKGLIPEYLTPDERRKGLLAIYNYYEDNSLAAVCETFAPFSNVVVMEGAVPEILPHIPSERIVYLSLDMNCALPEQRAVEYFWDRIVPGGVILHDDYGFELHEEQRKMLDRFAASRGVPVLALPTGQGIILKPS